MKGTTALVSKLYPKIEASMKKNLNAYKQCIGRFIEKRHRELYDIGPCDRIYFGATDLEDFWNTVKIDVGEVNAIVKETYYDKIAAFNPRAAKDEFTVSMMMIVRYLYLNKMEKELELACIHLAFSGKFYPSIHYSSFPKVQPSEYRHIMEFVVNSKLTNKYDLKVQGSIIGAVRSISKTWIDTYDRLFKSKDDEDVVYLIQQLHNRIKSFMKNIASEYYDVYNNKESYLAYDVDSNDEGSYRLVDNNSLRAERIIEKTMEHINTSTVDYRTCKMASDQNVKVEEVKSIIETIVNDPENINEVRELSSLIVSTYCEQSKTKDVRDIDFVTFTIAPKPNTKDQNILRQKEIIEKWLEEGSPAYRKRRSRLATKNSYHRSVYTYFALTIHNANK